MKKNKKDKEKAVSANAQTAGGKRAQSKSIEVSSSDESTGRRIRRKRGGANSENTIDMEDLRLARKKEKRRRLVKKLIIILIILLLGLAVYITRELWVPKLEGILDRPHDTIVNDGVAQSGNFPIDLNESSVNIIDRMDNNIIIADDSSIRFYDSGGSLRNTVYHNFGNPMIKTAGRRLLSYDNGGYTFRLYNKSGEVYERTIDDQIIYAALAENGNAAIVTQTEQYVACMTVYDANGTEIYRWCYGQRIMDISFTNDGAGCYISAFTTENGEIVSQIHYVEFDNTDELMRSENLDSLVYGVGSNNGGRIWAVGDEKFYLLNQSGEILDSYEYTADMISYSLNEDCAAVLTSGTARGVYRLAIFDCDADNVQPEIIMHENGTAEKVSCVDDAVYLLSSDSVDAYDVNGSLLATAEVDGNNTDFVYYNDAVYLMGYREVNKIEFQS